MFEHLVESGSHSEDIKRKGSFLVGFAGLYLVLIVVFAIAGIWYATANIDAQTLELTALIAPVPVQANQPKQEAKPEKVEITKNVDVRKELIADVSRAELVPKEVSAKASDIPPVRKGVVTMVGSANSNAIAPVAPGAGTGNIISAPAKVDVAEAPPPPPPKPTPPKAPNFGGRAQWKSRSSGAATLSGNCTQRARVRSGESANHYRRKRERRVGRSGFGPPSVAGCRNCRRAAIEVYTDQTFRHACESNGRNHLQLCGAVIETVAFLEKGATVACCKRFQSYITFWRIYRDYSNQHPRNESVEFAFRSLASQSVSVSGRRRQ
jgi:hypothetical protein